MAADIRDSSQVGDNYECSPDVLCNRFHFRTWSDSSQPLVSGREPSPTECTLTAIQAKEPKGTTITTVSVVSAANKLPEYCRIDGHVALPGNDFRTIKLRTKDNKLEVVTRAGYYPKRS
jgi:hypothetical protein